jgi:hypothetical protein
MILARFEWKPGGAADQFVWSQGNTVSEVVWDDPVDLVSFCQEVEDLLDDVIVYDGADIYQLKSFPKKDASV